MSRSAIYTSNTGTPTISAGGIIPVGNTVRRFGCNLRQDGNVITLCGQGYYLVNISVTVSPTAAGPVTLTAQKDGVAIIGATASGTAAAAADAVNLVVTCIVRNACGCESSILSLVLDSTATLDNLSVSVVKL